MSVNKSVFAAVLPVVLAFAVMVSACGGGSSKSTPTAPTSPQIQIRTITLSPHVVDIVYGPWTLYYVQGTMLQTTAVCRVDGQVVSCRPWWSSTNPSAITVNAQTGLLTFRNLGSSQICVQWSETETNPKNCVVFATRAISGSDVDTITLSPPGGSGRVGTTLQTTHECRINGQVVLCFNPYWWTWESGQVLSVEATTGLIRFIRRGSADVCVRWSQGSTSFPWACHTFTAQ